MEIDLIDQYKLHTHFFLEVCIMVNCTNSANGQLPRDQLYRIGEQLATEPYKKVNKSKLTHDEEF